jgi:hypothetical protein
METLEELVKHKVALQSYMKVKLEIEDYHAIRDCCVDLEIIDAKIKVIKAAKEYIKERLNEEVE